MAKSNDRLQKVGTPFRDHTDIRVMAVNMTV